MNPMVTMGISQVAPVANFCWEIQETEMQVPSLGWEDPLEEGMATHFGICPEEAQWTEEPNGLQSVELHRVMHD